MKMRAFILFSLLLHALVAGLLMWRKAPQPIPEEKIEISIRELPKGDLNSRSAKSSVRGRGKRISLSKLKPSWSSVLEPGPNEGRSIDPEARGTGEWPSNSWGAHQGGLLKEMEHYISYERVFQEIEGLLNYPGVLGQHDISGTFNVRLGFDDNSQCDWSRTSITEANHYLKFYVLALLKKLCGLDFMNRMRFNRATRIDINFNFVISDGLARDYDNAADSISGNVLLFRRTYVKPVGFYRIGPIGWTVFMPMGFTMDPMWFMQKWDEVMNHHDPLDEFRDRAP
jgi:hypothetical protein